MLARVFRRAPSIPVVTVPVFVWLSACCLFFSQYCELRRTVTGLPWLPTPSSVPGTLPSTQKMTNNEPLNGKKTGMDGREERKERRKREREGKKDGRREGEQITSLRSLP